MPGVQLARGTLWHVAREQADGEARVDGDDMTDEHGEAGVQTQGRARDVPPGPDGKDRTAWKRARPSDYGLEGEDAKFATVALSGRVKWRVTEVEFRTRAHSNPLNDGLFDVPVCPSAFRGDQHVQWLDVGCGYGGLALELACQFPAKHIMGMEIRDRVAEYCVLQRDTLRERYPGEYQNVSFVRTNAQKYLQNFVRKGQLEKIMFCYPDPHFKRRKWRQRVVTTQLLAIYAYVLQEGGRLYFVTDVKDLWDWMTGHTDNHPLFCRVEDVKDDPVASYVRNHTNEAARVEKSERPKFFACYERLPTPPL
ncbi:tRNA (guanine-N(7)-)-methyltransferase [Porphyridium purpureum]|uniref:tRNA (guanine-N(7)-)-methyltransferase n=1 Tax=Porphyridium purpureum TaxID=35688 RepID=A0A5J4YS02_PORPP|nr:tRNA (guanine-N(7)-)-methyltransferase [Porphyridium purpureum]|eukprot:POR8494..scf236_6